MKYSLVVLFSVFALTAFGQKDSTKKQYLGVLTLTEKYQDDENWTADAQAIVGQHFQRLLKFKKEGVVVLAGRTEYEVNNPEMVGLVIFVAKDEKEALQFMMDDPAVKNKIMQTKVHPYSVAIIKCD
jgi:uncharacterized protein YciI